MKARQPQDSSRPEAGVNVGPHLLRLLISRSLSCVYVCVCVRTCPSVCVGMHKQVVLCTYRGLARSCVLPVTLLRSFHFIFPGCEQDSLLFNTDAGGGSVMHFTLSVNFFQSWTESRAWDVTQSLGFSAGLSSISLPEPGSVRSPHGGTVEPGSVPQEPGSFFYLPLFHLPVGKMD